MCCSTGILACLVSIKNQKLKTRNASGTLVLILVFLFACSRQTERPADRIAVLRFENLTSDPSLDWMGRGISEVVAGQLRGSPRSFVIPFSTLHGFDRYVGASPLSAPGISAERTQALLARAMHIAYGQFSIVNSRLRLDAVLEEAANQRITRTASATGSLNDGLFPLAAAVSRQLFDYVQPFGTQNQEALRAYATALEASDASVAAEALSRAVAADPNFGAAYVRWSELALSQQDRAGAEKIFGLARSRGNKIPELDRAKLDTNSALLRGDAAAQIRALTALSSLTPSDASLFQTLADIELNRHDYRKAVEHYRRAVSLQPDEDALLNRLGYAQAYTGDLQGARQTLGRYERLRPDQANPLDSLGDVHFYTGKFSEAEEFYLRAYAKDANFVEGGALLKAAQARLMTGDIAAADTHFNRYFKSRLALKGSAVEVQRAEWEYLTGRRRSGIARLQAFARASESTMPAIASSGYSQLCVWELELGDQAQARQHALQARAAQSGWAPVFLFLTEPEASASEWALRAERWFPDGRQAAVKRLALTVALLFGKHFEAAIPWLREMHERSSPGMQEGTSILLAWALMESGRTEEAAPLLQFNPLPQAGGFAPLTSLYLPRIFFLRGRILERQGKGNQAKQNYRLFLTLSGPDPKIFSEEKNAREALAR